MFNDAAKIAIATSHTFFLARKSQVCMDRLSKSPFMTVSDFLVLFRISSALAKPITIRLVPCSPRAIFQSCAIVLSQL